MRRLAAALLVLVATVSHADGPTVLVGFGAGGGGGDTVQWLFSAGGATTLPTTAATYYWGVHGRNDSGFNASEALVGVVWPAAGTLSDFRVDLEGDIGTAGNDAQFTLMLDTSGFGSTSTTAIDCTITGGAGSETSCTDADTVSVAVGDRMTGRLIVTGTPTAQNVFIRMKFTPTTTNDTVLLFHATTASSSSARYHAPIGKYIQTTEANNGILFPLAGAITAIACASATDISGTMTRTYDFMVNAGAQSDVACVLNDAAQECSDTGSISIAAGDRVSIRDLPTNSATSPVDVSCGVVFEPTTSGRMFVATIQSGGWSTTADRYYEPNNANVTGQSTESNVSQVSPGITLKSIYASATTAPGGSTDFILTARENNGDSALTCTISGAATTCNAATDVTVENANTFNLESDPSASAPTAPGVTRISVEVQP